MVVKVEHGDDEDMYIPNVGGETTRRDQTKNPRFFALIQIHIANSPSV